jgi:hypothetical protein
VENNGVSVERLNLPVETLGNQWGKVEIEHPAVITVTTGCGLIHLHEKYLDYITRSIRNN